MEDEQKFDLSDVVIRMLRYFGMWSTGEDVRNIGFYLVRILLSVESYLFFISFPYECYLGRNDVMIILEAFFLIFTVMFLFFKTYYFFRHNDSFQMLVDTMEKISYASRQNISEEEQKIIDKTVKHVKLLPTIYMAVSNILVVIYIIGSFIILLPKRELYYRGWFPFDTKVSPNFEIILTLYGLAVIAGLFYSSMVDGLLMKLLLENVGQFRLLRYRLENLRQLSLDIIFVRRRKASDRNDAGDCISTIDLHQEATRSWYKVELMEDDDNDLSIFRPSNLNKEKIQPINSETIKNEILVKPNYDKFEACTSRGTSLDKSPSKVFGSRIEYLKRNKNVIPETERTSGSVKSCNRYKHDRNIILNEDPTSKDSSSEVFESPTENSGKRKNAIHESENTIEIMRNKSIYVPCRDVTVQSDDSKVFGETSLLSRTGNNSYSESVTLQEDYVESRDEKSTSSESGSDCDNEEDYSANQKIDETLAREMEIQLNKCIEHHQAISRFTLSLESTFSAILVNQFIVNVVPSGLLLIWFTVVPSLGFKEYNFALLLAAFYFQLATFCYLGNKITEESFKVNNAIYNSDWFGTSEGFKRSMRIIMSKSNQPVTIKAGGYIGLSMESFLNVSKMTYNAYMTVLTTIKGDKLSKN